jgi:hypothetical protein
MRSLKKAYLHFLPAFKLRDTLETYEEENGAYDATAASYSPT